MRDSWVYGISRFMMSAELSLAWSSQSRNSSGMVATLKLCDATPVGAGAITLEWWRNSGFCWAARIRNNVLGAEDMVILDSYY